jgi:deoxyribose-phosphate aldolase
MEQKLENEQIFTKAEGREKEGVLISKSEAEEYRTYKQQQAISSIVSAMQKSQGSLLSEEEVQRVCERAVRYRQTEVETPLSRMSAEAFYLSKKSVRLNCVVGGTGETSVKVKAYETRLAVKAGAKEITLVLTPSLVNACRYGELRREIKRVRRACKRAQLKVRVEKSYPPTILSRIARLCSELGVQYFSVPNFQGCERLRMDVNRGCGLEVFGVETLEDYRRLLGAGVGRIVTNRVAEFYSSWLRIENEKMFSSMKTEVKTHEDGKNSSLEQGKVEKIEEKPKKVQIAPPNLLNSETDYRCQLDGTQLKFL